jgi:hypothetical protein
MAAQLILEFEGITTKEYFVVNEALGSNAVSGDGDWPDGIVSHSAGLNEAGDLIVFEVGESQAHQKKFMNDRLSAALVEAE